MSTSTNSPASGTDVIDAIPVRHPWRSVAAVFVALVLAMLAHQLVTNPAFDWSFTFDAMRQVPVAKGFWFGVMLVTIGAMVIGVIGGVLLAIMRMSPNKLLSGVAFAYAWFFRSIPRYVLLSILGGAGAFFPQGVGIGIPYGAQLMNLFGVDNSLKIATLDANQLFTGYLGAILGLAMSEAAYFSEIARSGIISVDKGQHEAATALGMTRGQAMRRIILPQAMRVIIPPMGNETIAMFKDTSLLIALPLAGEMLFQLRSIGTNYYKMIPVYMAASLYYLITTTIMMIGQSWLEKRFGRGHAPLDYTGGDH
ncbi:polar amino acid transport system permease protein [Luteococcus japonicus]|uniref:ABC amino acid transporter, permease component n=2 Tax=Luteococcus japonicus TaxID=33984 RepID=A0A1R4JJ81_9ACTN|nr:MULTISPECIES: amino acid ABC transporter permease [Luteococcus]MDN5562756.1 amino acid ABC transporter permease [Luteococcus sp.]ROR53108.1 polar amino acid transport system permease protein [Luteococcus japonicus]SJN32068.1 ABC amino acid transporter, permease component [Luteococcus japonicus LSP_Lj1]